MTEQDKMLKLETMTGEHEQELLAAYLDSAADVIINRRNPNGDGTEEFEPRYDRLQVEIAAYMLNRRGMEGEIVHVENGVNSHFADGDVPPSLLRRIVPKVKTLGSVAPLRREDREDGEAQS